jgi:hypothetical protein
MPESSGPVVENAMRNRLLVVSLVPVLLFVAVFLLHLRPSIPPVLDERFSASDAGSDVRVDHTSWQQLLDDYLVVDTQSGVNLFDYEGLLDDGHESLDEYIAMLAAIDPLTLNRSTQKAYWINLYNALTVQLILRNYPVSSITILGSSVKSFGPWDDQAVAVNGIDLSLNDIEHRIIRPLYDDYRIHFAVNCASIGCPDLAAEAFDAATLDTQLDDAAALFMQHERAMRFDGDTLYLSSLFKWYSGDFGNSLTQVLATLSKHLPEAAAQQLTSAGGLPKYEYDWSLNGYCHEEASCGE